MSRPKFKPTAAQSRQVEALAGIGVKEEMIADLTGEQGIDPKTLRRHFRKELDRGIAKANAKVAQTAYDMAISGNATMVIFWLKTRAGWRERPVLDPLTPTTTTDEITETQIDAQILATIARQAERHRETEVPQTSD